MAATPQSPTSHPRSCKWNVVDDWWWVLIDRFYYKVVTPTALLEIYCDLNTGDWFLERVID